MTDRSLAGWRLLSALSVVLACSNEPAESGGKPSGAGKPAKGPAQAPADPAADADPRRRALAETAQTLVSRIGQLEIERDVTCWTSFRQLDAFIASKEYSDFATVTKIVATKALVQAVWAAASKKSAGGNVSKGDLEGVVGELAVELPEEKKAELQKFAQDHGLQEFRDYRTTSEHYRVLLSIAQDELVRPQPELDALTDDGAEALALVATRLGLSLLTESGEIATGARSAYIEATHVQQAYKTLRERHSIPSYTPSDFEADAQTARALRVPITQGLIAAKIKALREYNDATENVFVELNKVSRIPLSRAAAARMEAELMSFARFLAKGFSPMRADNYLADGNFEPADIKGLDYVDPAYAENTIMQIFPHVMMPNGDLKLRFEPRPGHISPRELKAQDVTLLDHHMNAVRDTAVHWTILQKVFEREPFAMEAFAAEYISEIVSVLGTFYLLRAQTMARQEKAEEITDEHIARVRDVGYVMVMPQSSELSPWGEDRVADKARVLSTYPAGPLFVDGTAAAGLPTDAPAGAPGVSPDAATFDIQEVMGSGAAVGDVDGDGHGDLFITGPGQHRLYRSRGDGTFEDVSKAWGITGSGDDGRAALFVDFDGDDDLDLFVAHSRTPSELYVNDGGKLANEAATRGLKTGRGAHSATWLDFDGDGDLDLYLGYYGSASCNRGECKGRNLPSLDGRNGTPNELWRNDGGTLVEAGGAAGVADPGWTLAVSAFDYDLDGDLDLYLANDFGANPLFRNDGGTFVDVAAAMSAADRGSGMNVSFTDLDADGAFDVYVSNIDMFSKTVKVVFPQDESVVDLDARTLRAFSYLSGNKLYRNAKDDAGHRRFESVEGQYFEPGDRGWGWAAPFEDFDGDGDEDMMLSNGWIPGSPADAQRNQLFVRDEDTFYRVPDPDSDTDADADAEPGVDPGAAVKATSGAHAGAAGFSGNSRALLTFDADGDLDPDVVVTGYREAPRLLINEQRGGRFVGLRLQADGPNTRAVGAVVKVEGGPTVQRRTVTCGEGYLGQRDEVLRLGVGGAKKVDVTVTWPGGKTQSFKGLPTGAVHDLVAK